MKFVTNASYSFEHIIVCHAYLPTKPEKPNGKTNSSLLKREQSHTHVLEFLKFNKTFRHISFFHYPEVLFESKLIKFYVR